MRKIRIILTAVILYMALSLVFSGHTYETAALKSLKKETPKVNIVMPGMYFIDGDNVYYISQLDNYIHKVKTDGSGRGIVGRDAVFTDGMLLSGMMVYDGCIYYINDSDSQRLYRIREDGTGRVCLTKASIDTSDGMFILNNYIYYFSNWKYYKISLDGKPSSLTAGENEICRLYFNSFRKVLSGEYIYFSQLDGLYRIKADGSDKRKLISGAIYDFAVYGDSVYYINEKDLCLYRDGKKIVSNKILCDTGDAWHGGFGVKDGYIYFSNADDKMKLYRIKADGTEKIKLTDDSALSLKVDDSIYFINDFDNGSLKRISLDGRDKKEIARAPLLNVYSIEGDCVFYSAKWEEENEYYLGRLFMAGKDGKNIVEMK